jgi:hypothetical protein
MTPDARSLVFLIAEDRSAALSAGHRLALGGPAGIARAPVHERDVEERLGATYLAELAEAPDRPPAGPESDALEEIAALRPAALVAGDPLAAVLAHRWAPRLGARTIAVIGSLWLDPLWAAARLDRYVVPDVGSARRLADAGIPAGSVTPMGLGLCGRFGEGAREGREGCRRRMGLPEAPRALLLTSRGVYADELAAWIAALADLPDPPLLLVDAATDRLCLATAREALARHGLPGAAYGKLEGAGYLWGGADAVAGRADDTTVTRALTYRIPQLLVDPKDDRQRGIVAALESVNAGVAVASPADLHARLAAGPAWAAPLDAATLNVVAGDGVPARIAAAITQLVASE